MADIRIFLILQWSSYLVSEPMKKKEIILILTIRHR